MATDLAPGVRIGRWTLISESPDKLYGVHPAWFCRCDCGTVRAVAASPLRRGKTQSCGCLVGDMQSAKREDLTGRRFGRLAVVEPRESQRWLCRCDCGNEVSVARSHLIDGKTQSCGCLRSERISTMKDDRERGRRIMVSLCVEGTAIPAIKPTRRVNRNSSTGVRGVSVSAKGYRSTIVFKRKQYDLGTYPTIEAAAAARERAEKEIYGPFLEWYESQKEKQPPSE